MEWLMDNPIANMYGPHFLLFYGAVCILTILAGWIMRRTLDWTRRMPAPMIPATPDPYEIAYLRGGESEVTRTVIFGLMQRGYLRASALGAGQMMEQAPEHPDRRALAGIERRAFDWFAAPREVKDIFNAPKAAPQGRAEAGALADAVKAFCAPYRQRLQSEHLLTPPSVIASLRLLQLAGALVIFGLGAYKLFVALARGRTNIGFLIIIGIVALVIFLAVARAERLSARGREYIKRLQLAFERLRPRGATQMPGTTQTLGLTQPLGAANGFDPTLLLLVSVFGVGALAGTPHESYQRMFPQTGGSGGSGGGCSASSGSSCSSSSCGGGGCGGGGCGGCGS